MPITALITQGESQELEYKTSFDKAAIKKYGSGFLRIRKALAEYPEVRFSIQEAQGGIWAVFEKASQVGIVGVGEGVKVESKVAAQLGERNA